ncbi:uncharacterized protein LOC123685892 [Harmonia axyridis]|uniref:uncharacterized protein LOC123685892 n=1 Tax=Harmonia axyridis TaxID=115357 RepID=UPI001E27656F|nr:uncharacterized protein LOC123685892 [Harmonia axyridis]
MNSFVTENTSKARSLWLYVDDLCGKTRPKTEIDSVESSNGQLLTSKKEMVKEFGIFFSEIGKRLAENIDEVPEKEEGERYCDNTTFLFPTSEDEVRGMIRELKNGGAPGNDGIRTELIKNIQDEIMEHIMLLANLCFETAEFPNIFKVGVIKPLFKSGDKTILSHYRPIGLTSNLSKIVEKLLKMRIVNFLEKNKILSDNQYGFRKGKSTQDAIKNVVEKIYQWLDGNKGTVLGPILFIIYMNSLLLMKRKGEIISFADDTVIMYEDSTWKKLKQEAEGDLSIIKQWFGENRLTINLQKTKYLPFVAYQSGLPHMGNLEVDNETSIPEAEYIKYLGVTILIDN